MNYAKIDKLQRDEDKNNLILVDRLWKLKKASEKKLALHIQLNKLVRDLDYRANLISNAKKLNDPSINKLILDIERVQESNKINDKKRLSSPEEHLDSFFSDDQEGKRLKVFTALVLTLIVLLLIFMFQFYRSLKHDNRLNEMNSSVQYSFPNTPPNSASLDQPARLVASASNNSKTSAQEPDFSLTPSLRFHGSNTIGEKLIPKLVEAFYLHNRAQDLQWKNSDIPTEKNLLF